MGELVAQLRAALPVDAASLAALPEDDLLALVQTAEALGRVVDGARVLVAGEVAERSRPALGPERMDARRGCRSPGEVLERAGLISCQTARGRMRAASAMRATWSLSGEMLPGGFPILRRAVEDGRVSVDAAVAIVGELGPVVDRDVASDAIGVAEAELVGAAAGGTGAPAASADEVRVMAQAWALFLDPDGAAPDAAPADRRRGLTIGRVRDGLVSVQAGLLPEVAAQLRRVLDAYAGSPVGPTFVEAAEEGLDGIAADVDHRSPAQRRHDSFAGILTVAAGHAAAPQIGGAAPTLVVTVSADELAREGGAAFVSGDEGEIPVATAVARHAGCAGAVQRVVFDQAGRIIEIGVPQRIFGAHQRRAIAARDGECIIPGCHVAAAWCEVHHVSAHARGGPTHTDNGVLLCWRHHSTIETGGWQIEMREGVPWVRAPGWIDAHRSWRPVQGTIRHRLARMRA